MDGRDAPRQGPNGAGFGSSMLVALGWYVVVGAVVLLGLSGIPTKPDPDPDCSEAFSCLSRGDELGLLFVLIGIPVLGGGAVLAVLFTALLARHIRSPFVVGTVSALCGAVGVVVLAATLGLPGVTW